MNIALITGASSGIGREFALQLKAAGEVDGFWLVARREDRLRELADMLGESKVICADLGTHEGLDILRSALESEKPTVKYLVCAAGFGKFGTYETVSDEDTEKMIDLNVKALVFTTYMTIPYMCEGSHIIEMGSASNFTPLPGFNIYASGKAFVVHFSKALAYEVKPKGISVTAFCPGWVATEFLPKAEEHDGGPRVKKPMLNVSDVVAVAIRDARRGRVLCVCNWYTKLQHLLSKLLPYTVLTRAWLKMLK